MSKRYIECEAAKEQIRAHIIIGEPKTNVGLNLAIEAIDEVPAADVVEVVRCRECKHSIMYKFSYNYERVLVCNKPGVTIKAVKPMHFCADGERKDGGQDDV